MTETALPDLDGDRLREECGVFGIFGHPDAAAITALGLHALQHRGQEAAGIVSFDGKRSIPNGALVSSATRFRAARSSTACRATPPSVMSAIRPPAKPFCATCSRCSPSSMPAASP